MNLNLKTNSSVRLKVYTSSFPKAMLEFSTKSSCRNSVIHCRDFSYPNSWSTKPKTPIEPLECKNWDYEFSGLDEKKTLELNMMKSISLKIQDIFLKIVQVRVGTLHALKENSFYLVKWDTTWSRLLWRRGRPTDMIIVQDLYLCWQPLKMHGVKFEYLEK